jgi:hypothetical protein
MRLLSGIGTPRLAGVRGKGVDQVPRLSADPVSAVDQLVRQQTPSLSGGLSHEYVYGVLRVITGPPRLAR